VLPVLDEIVWFDAGLEQQQKPNKNKKDEGRVFS
jgi:hypothetical protein